jgi:hypothetical protein
MKTEWRIMNRKISSSSAAARTFEDCGAAGAMESMASICELCEMPFDVIQKNIMQKLEEKA